MHCSLRFFFFPLLPRLHFTCDDLLFSFLFHKNHSSQDKTSRTRRHSRVPKGSTSEEPAKRLWRPAVFCLVWSKVKKKPHSAMVQRVCAEVELPWNLEVSKALSKLADFSSANERGRRERHVLRRRFRTSEPERWWCPPRLTQACVFVFDDTIEPLLVTDVAGSYVRAVVAVLETRSPNVSPQRWNHSKRDSQHELPTEAFTSQRELFYPLLADASSASGCGEERRRRLEVMCSEAWWTHLDGSHQASTRSTGGPIGSGAAPGHVKFSWWAYGEWGRTKSCQVQRVELSGTESHQAMSSSAGGRTENGVAPSHVKFSGWSCRERSRTKPCQVQLVGVRRMGSHQVMSSSAGGAVGNGVAPSHVKFSWWTCRKWSRTRRDVLTP